MRERERERDRERDRDRGSITLGVWQTGPHPSLPNSMQCSYTHTLPLGGFAFHSNLHQPPFHSWCLSWPPLQRLLTTSGYTLPQMSPSLFLGCTQCYTHECIYLEQREREGGTQYRESELEMKIVTRQLFLLCCCTAGVL